MQRYYLRPRYVSRWKKATPISASDDAGSSLNSRPSSAGIVTLCTRCPKRNSCGTAAVLCFLFGIRPERKLLGKRGDVEKVDCSMRRDALLDPQLTEPAGTANDLSNPSVGARRDEALGCR